MDPDIQNGIIKLNHGMNVLEQLLNLELLKMESMNEPNSNRKVMIKCFCLFIFIPSSIRRIKITMTYKRMYY